MFHSHFKINWYCNATQLQYSNQYFTQHPPKCLCFRTQKPGLPSKGIHMLPHMKQSVASLLSSKLFSRNLEKRFADFAYLDGCQPGLLVVGPFLVNLFNIPQRHHLPSETKQNIHSSLSHSYLEQTKNAGQFLVISLQQIHYYFILV